MLPLTDLSGLIKDRKFSLSNWLLNRQLKEPLMDSCQLQGVELRSFFFKEMEVCIVSSFVKISAVFCCQKVVFAAQERLSSPALIHIHYLTYIDLRDWYVSKKHPRKLELSTHLKDHDTKIKHQTSLLFFIVTSPIAILKTSKVKYSIWKKLLLNLRRLKIEK